MRPALLAAVMLCSVTALAQPVLLTGASAAATWDSNATRSPVPEGGLFLDALAHVGGGLGLADDRVLLTALAMYRGSVGVSTSALSSHVGLGSLTGSVRVVPWLRLGLSAGGGYAALADPPRSGPRFDARGFARARPTDWLTLRAGYGWLSRWAQDPTFTFRTHEVSARAEVRPLDWLEVSAGWRLSMGGDVVFVETTPSTAGGTSGGGGPGSGWRGAQAFTSGSGLTWTPTPVEAVTHGLDVTGLAELPGGFAVGLELGWTTSRNALQPWSGWLASLLVSWDLPG